MHARHEQRVLVRRQIMSLVSYLMFIPPVAYAIHYGWFSFGYEGLLLFIAASVAINVFFFGAIRMGWATRTSDRSLLLVQIWIATLLALAMSYFAIGAQVVTLLLFFTAFFFGVFSLTTRQYLLLAAVVIVEYAAMLWLKTTRHAAAALHVELLYFMGLVIILLWMSLMGGYVSRLRSIMGRQKSALEIAMGKLQELSIRDELTGAFNRRHLMNVLQLQHERAARHGECFSVCILDLDNFKRLNDSHGHQVGDEVLKGFSARLQAQVRGLDSLGHRESGGTFGRYGGEEFVLLMPYACADDAMRAVGRLQRDVNATPFATSAGPIAVTFSAGVAQFVPGEMAEDVLRRADAALYRAKADGRDRLQLAR